MVKWDLGQDVFEYLLSQVSQITEIDSTFLSFKTKFHCKVSNTDSLIGIKDKKVFYRAWTGHTTKMLVVTDVKIDWQSKEEVSVSFLLQEAHGKLHQLGTVISSFKGNATFTIKNENCGVYLGKCEYIDKTLLKIGKSTDVHKRYLNHKVSNPGLKMLGYIRSGQEGDLERELHNRFSSKKYSTEWFYSDAQILNFFTGHSEWVPLSI